MFYATQNGINAGSHATRLHSLIDAVLDKGVEQVIYRKEGLGQWEPFVRVVPGNPLPQIIRVLNTPSDGD